MAATGTGVRMKGGPALINRMDKLGGAIQRKFEMHRRIGIELVKWGQRNFKASGLEHKWKPLKRSTVAARRKGSSKPLQDTGRLRQSFLHFRATESMVRWGSPMKIASYAHFGTKAHEIKAKKKLFLKFTGVSGKPVFRKSVKHPGTPPRPLLPSNRLADRIAKTTIDGYIKEHIK